MDDGTEQANRSRDQSGEGPQGAAGAPNPLITVRFDPAVHNGNDFVCSRSERIHNFFKQDCRRLLEKCYCRVFVVPDPDDKSHIMGFYTLSPGLIDKGAVSTQHQKRIMLGLPIPMILIGFLGRDDRLGKEAQLGSLLIHDAALRIYLSEDIIAWGIYLDPENDGLVKWYAANGFRPTKERVHPANLTGVDAPPPVPARPAAMYVPLKDLLPEIAGLP